MAENRNYRRTSGTYVYGNAAPSAVPKKTRKEERREREEAVLRTRLEMEKRVSEKRIGNRAWPLSYVAVIAGCAVMTAVLLFVYLNKVADYRSNLTGIAALEKTYQHMVQENVLIENRQEAFVDYNKVYTVATEELGMRLPEKQQVVYYNAGGTEYVAKAGDIPNE